MAFPSLPKVRINRKEIFSFCQRNRAELLLTGGYFFALLLVWPAGDFALNDDWTYGRSVMLLHEQGNLVLGSSSASLVAHLYWGLLFVKIFGFSFTVLRVSSWVAVCIFIWLGYGLFRRITGNTAAAAVFVLVMIFNPVFFSISNTFMTDVNFCLLIICCVWSARNFWNRQRTIHFVAFFIFSLLLAFIRQFGLVVPAVFILTCLMLRHRKLMWASISLAAFLLIFLLLMLFERAVFDTEAAGYQSPFKFNVFSAGFWEHVRLCIVGRHEHVVCNTSVYTAPILVIFLWPFIRIAGWTFSIFALAASLVFAYMLFEKEAFPLGNILFNTSLGAETFHESLKWPPSPRPHTFSEQVKTIFDVVAYVSVTVTLMVLLLLSFVLVTGLAKIREPVLFTFCLLFIGAYVFVLLVPDIFFDRYHLPLPIAFGLLAASVHPARNPVIWPAVIYLVPMMYVSIAGTGDYFRLHRIVHRANDHLRKELGVPMNRINAGHEINNWHEGQEYVTWETLFVSSHNYVIQYNNLEGFRPYRAYEFRRFFPPKNDKIYIFERIEKIP